MENQDKIERLEAENARLKAECYMYKTFYRAKHNDVKGILFKYKTCLKEIKDIAENEIKRYLNDKGIHEEYGKLAYIFACIRNKIKDDSNNISLDTSLGISMSDYEEETEEQLQKRIDRMKKKKTSGISVSDIMKLLNKK